MKKKLKHKEVRNLIKRNEFQEMIENSRDYVRKNAENIVIFSVIILIIVVAVPLYLKNKNATEIKAEQLLSRADYYINRPVVDKEDATMYGAFRTEEEKYDKAITVYKEILQTYRGTKSLARAYLGLAGAYYNKGEYKEALDYFNSFIEKFPGYGLTAEAVNGRAYTFYQMGKYDEAAADWEKVAGEFKEAYLYYDVKLRLADCYLKKEEYRKAEKIYKEIIEEKKGSYWANMAKEKIEGIN